jgi:hypothetical protein
MNDFIPGAKIEQLRFGFSNIFVIAKFAQINQPGCSIHRSCLSDCIIQPVAQASAWLDLYSSAATIAETPALSGSDFNICKRPSAITEHDRLRIVSLTSEDLALPSLSSDCN